MSYQTKCQQESSLKYVKIQTKDGIIHNIPIEIALQFNNIKNMLSCPLIKISKPSEDGGWMGDPIQYSLFTSQHIDIALKYIEHHDKEISVSDQTKDQLIKKFNLEITQMNKEELSEAIKIIDFIGHEPLLSRICDGIVEKIKGKTPEEVREIFGLKDDLTMQEKEKIEKKYKYLIQN